MLHVRKFKVKFYKTPNTCINEFKTNIDSFFQRCHLQKVQYSINGREIKINNFDHNHYEEDIYTLEYEISYQNITKNFQLDNLTAEICRNWCQNGLHLYWLIPLRNESFYYEEKMFDCHVKLSEFSFGTIPDMKHFVRHYHYKELSHKSEIMSSFFHNHKYFHLYMSIGHNESCKNDTSHIFNVQYSSIARIIVNMTLSDYPTELFFELSCPPLIYVTVDDEKNKSRAELDTISQASAIEYEVEKLERTLEFGCSCKKSLCYIKRIGRTPVMKILITDKYRVRRIVERLVHRCSSKIEVCYSNIKTEHFPHRLADIECFPSISKNLSSVDIFNCQYSWRAVFSRSLIVHDYFLLKQNTGYNVKKFQQKVSQYANEDPSALSETFFCISEMIGKSLIIVFENAIDKLFPVFCRKIGVNELPNGMCLARRIIIAPSRLIILPPTEHFDNRVIRRFGVEYILRISIQDDNFSKLTFGIQNHSAKEEFMYRTVGNILLKGIHIGLRHYEVLACSNSQLREHGMWLYARDTEGNTSSSIRSWMGDFSEIKSIAKYMSRMGQCFSTSEVAVQLSVDLSNEIALKDIRSRRGYIFSDGIGTISSELAEEVRMSINEKSIMHIKSEDIYKPSAFQIRYKGCKGMVAENPNLHGRLLGLRPSMKKFDCKTSQNLEIVKLSAPRKLFLNRPLITILEQSGVPPSVFLKLQKNMILQLTNSLIYEAEASLVLKYYIPLDIPYLKLQEAGITLTTEPFFRSLLLSVYKASVKQLRSKLRIAIPEQYGRNMLGVLDETGILEYGQVFVQYSEKTVFCRSDLHILKGTVVVTKNPCMHPGDVRKFEAVDVEKLHHIKDCIVFPSRGERPHPNEMAGSDLDGDEFVVIWYQDLIFPRNNYFAMEYPIYYEISECYNMGVEDMVKFFCIYIQNDNIGVFANAHLAWADQHPDGVFSRTCMDIAKKFPFVLDFAKTGTSQRLAKSERPTQYPDFMEKGSKCDNYFSKKSLGLLYRTTRHLESCVSKIEEVPQFSEFDPYLCYPGWKEYEDSADQANEAYTARVTSILNKYGILNEAEAISGYIEGNLYNQDRNEKANIISIVKTYLADIMSRYRYKFLQEVEKECASFNFSDEEKQKHMYQRASAWYMVVYTKGSSRIISFPWVVSDILVKVRLECLTLIKNSIKSFGKNFLEDLDAVIKEAFSSMFEDSAPQSKNLCGCVIICRVALKRWMFNMGLNLNVTEGKGCLNCFDRIFEYFLSTSEANCCSSSLMQECSCAINCSPSRFIFFFMQFFICDNADSVSNFLGTCREDCDGFIVLNLQGLALQTVANLAVTHDAKYLGIDLKTDSCLEEFGIKESIIDMEGDMIRIPVKTDAHKEFIQQNMEQIKSYLKKHSGVREVIITTDHDIHFHWFLLISSTGKSWQRWNLEELIMDPHFLTKLETSIKKNNSK